MFFYICYRCFFCLISKCDSKINFLANFPSPSPTAAAQSKEELMKSVANQSIFKSSNKNPLQQLAKLLAKRKEKNVRNQNNSEENGQKSLKIKTTKTSVKRKSLGIRLNSDAKRIKNVNCVKPSQQKKCCSLVAAYSSSSSDEE